MTIKWCIYYSDRSKYSYLDGRPEKAPVVGVQFIAQSSESNIWEALCNQDFYIWDTRDGVTKWYCADNAGRENYMREIGWRKVLIGSWIGDETYESISRQVSHDIQVGRKAGYAPWEWKPGNE
jgi:hypothetical protein